MANLLDRTWYNTLVDDDGSGTTGTVWNKTAVDSLLDAVDASLATVVDKSGAVVANEIPAFLDGDTIKGGSGLTAAGGGNITRATAAGADNGSALMSGSGAVDVTRGAYLYASGNQAGGFIGLAMGNIAGAAVIFYRGSPAVPTFQILSTGVVSLLDGQLQFPTTQKASADPYTVDDYRELPWTPGIGGTGGASGQTYAFQRGSYQKVGRWVTADFYLGLAGVGTILGDVTITGLPYPNSTADGGIVRTCPIAWHDLNVGYLYLNGLLDPGATVLRLAGAVTAHTSAISPPFAPTSLKATTYLLGTIRYPAAN